MKELKDLISKVLTKVEYMADNEEHMPLGMKDLQKEIKDYDKAYKETGYSSTGLSMSEITSKKNEFNGFTNDVQALGDKLKIMLESDKLSDFGKLSRLESIDDVLKVSKLNSISPTKMRHAIGEMNFNLSALVKEYTSMIPEDKVIIDKINKSLESSVDKKVSLKNT